MTPDDLEQFLDLGQELPNFECKEPRPVSDTHFFAKVARATIAMANRQDGGIIVIGVVEDSSGRLEVKGLAAEDIATWVRFDDVKAKLASYTDPVAELVVQHLQIAGRDFIAIEVSEFRHDPIICKKDFKGVLRRGACYVRSRLKPESVEAAESGQMRDLLDLALQKRLQSFLNTALQSGLAIPAEKTASDASRYDAELEEYA